MQCFMAAPSWRQLFGDSQWKRSAVTAWSLYWVAEENLASSLCNVTNIS